MPKHKSGNITHRHLINPTAEPSPPLTPPFLKKSPSNFNPTPSNKNPKPPMGNCSPKPNRRARSSQTQAVPSPPVTQLHGTESSLIAWRIRVALLYKRVAFEFVESEEAGEPFLRCGSESLTGSEETLLRYIDKRFGGAAAAAAKGREREGRGMVAEVVGIQHRSMEQHVEGMGRWAEKMMAEGGEGWKGRAAEGRRMGKLYGDLVEIMLEHAQMEERLLFPALDRAADYDVCRTANEEHGRDLPLMNGIKEDIKSLIAMDVGGPMYKEALLNLSLRFRTLQEHCKQHFESEDRELMPLLESAERARRKEDGEEPNRWVEQMVDLMEQTHSRLLPFFASALFPHEALRYVSLVSAADDQRAIAMLRSIALSFETFPRAPFLPPFNASTN